MFDSGEMAVLIPDFLRTFRFGEYLTLMTELQKPEYVQMAALRQS